MLRRLLCAPLVMLGAAYPVLTRAQQNESALKVAPPPRLSQPATANSTEVSTPRENGTAENKATVSAKGCVIGDGWSTRSGRLLMATATAAQPSEFTISIVDLDQRRINTPDFSFSSPAPSALFSPDGTQVALTERNGSDRNTIIADWDGSARVSIPQLTGHELAAWRADGSLLAFRPSDGSVAVLARDATRSFLGSKIQTLTTIAPGRISAVRTRNGNETDHLVYVTDANWPGLDICIRNITSRSDACVLGGSGNFSQPRIDSSAAQDRIAYTIGDTAVASIGVLDRSAGTKQLWITGEQRFSQPIWGEDGKWLAAVGEFEEDIRIVISDGPGKQTQTVVQCPRSEIARVVLLDWSKRKTLEVEAARVKREAPLTGSKSNVGLSQ